MMLFKIKRYRALENQYADVMWKYMDQGIKLNRERDKLSRVLVAADSLARQHGIDLFKDEPDDLRTPLGVFFKTVQGIMVERIADAILEGEDDGREVRSESHD